MAPSIIANDIELHLPDFTVVSASAGSGKTHTLTLKLLQLLLSERVPNNRLNNIIAMTFTKNAAAEMRKRVLEYLKHAYFGDQLFISRIEEVVALKKDQISVKAGELIDSILLDYSAFQIQTIDSFIARVFRASALDYGYSPAIEIIMESQNLLEEASEQFIRELPEEESKKKLLEEITAQLIDSRSQSRYVWNPFKKLSQEVRGLYEMLSAQSKEILLPEDKDTKRIKKEISENFQQLVRLVRQSGLETTTYFENAVAAAESGDIEKLISGSNSGIEKPLKAGKNKAEKDKKEFWDAEINPLIKNICDLKNECIKSYAEQYYRPSVQAYRLFQQNIERIMRRNNRIYISDVTRVLLSYISQEIVPQVYFYLGEAITHYLIDEFQDTSHVQWDALKPLLEETLSKRGSLFIVGDTKQSIYGFRHADWHIMQQIMDTIVFPSAPPQVKKLEVNYRSFEQIVEFTKMVFNKILPQHYANNAPDKSGLSAFSQVVESKNRNKGYVEVTLFEQDEERLPEREDLLRIISDCHSRGYEFKDITILTPRNKDVVAVSGWLNSRHIPFISHSSLDIRSRRITGDIFSLLRFLDSPIDDLAFASFILSKTFIRILSETPDSPSGKELRSFILNARKEKQAVPLYTAFRAEYPSIWKNYFDQLYTVVGYLPLYDLVTEIIKRFRLFSLISEEEGTLAKLLGVIKYFEDRGQNNLKDFLEFTEEEDGNGIWNFILPRDAAAVQIMTIHKAKGLDSRVVIVLLYDSRNIQSLPVLKEEADGIRLIHVTKKEAELIDELGQLYEEHRLKQDVDELNKLYVALTRAGEEMYIISVKNDRDGKPSKFFQPNKYGSKSKPDIEKKTSDYIKDSGKIFSEIPAPADTAGSEKLAVYERQRGDCIHAIMSQIEYLDDHFKEVLPGIIEKETENTPLQPEASRIQSIISGALVSPDLNGWFTPKNERRVLNEQEFVDIDGSLNRMDRVVFDKDMITVIDYKTGSDKEEYTAQVKKYMNILKSCYPDKTVHGVLVFFERCNFRNVE